MHRNDILSLLTMVVGVASLASDAAFGTLLDSLLPNHAASETLAALGILGMVASQVIRVLSVPAGQTTVNPTTPAAAPAPQNGESK